MIWIKKDQLEIHKKRDQYRIHSIEKGSTWDPYK